MLRSCRRSSSPCSCGSGAGHADGDLSRVQLAGAADAKVLSGGDGGDGERRATRSRRRAGFVCVRASRQASNPRAPAAMEQSDALAAALRQIGGGKPTPVAHSPRRDACPRRAQDRRAARLGTSVPVGDAGADNRACAMRDTEACRSGVTGCSIRSMQHSPGQSRRASWLLSRTTTSSRDGAARRHRDAQCASWRRIAGAIACASTQHCDAVIQ
jgi:hypothetical protein